MYIYEQTPVEDYLRYYKNQAGLGQPHPGISTFRGPVYQRGNGLGSIFSSLWRAITPLFKNEGVRSALRTAGTSALTTGLNVGSDILEGRNFSQSLKRRAGATGADLLNSAAEELRQISGRGRIHRKRRATSKKPRKAKRRKTAKKKTTKKRKPRKSTKGKKSTKAKPRKKRST